MKNSLLKVGIAVFLLLSSLRPVTDPDTGWHLATGRYIVENGWRLPMKDSFSYSQDGQAYIAHSWLSDVGMYFLERSFGMIGLSAVYAFMGLMIFLILAKTADQKYHLTHSMVYLPLIAYGVVEIIGQRPQIITVMALSLIGLVNSLPKSKQRKWYIPTIFLFWANLHGGGVILGLVIYAFTIITSNVNLHSKKERRAIMASFFLALLASLINPYAHQIFSFSLGMVGNQIAAIYNADWVPLFSARLPDNTFGLRLIIFAISCVAIIDNREHKQAAVASAFFLMLSLRSIRFLVPLVPLITSLILLSMAKISREAKLKKWLTGAIIGSVVVSSLGASALYQKLTCSQNAACYGKLAGMPYHAAQFIKQQGLTGNYLNYYTWGGYLDWQVPEIKIFIDGRMDNFFINGQSFLTEFVVIDRMQAGWYETLLKYGTNAAIIPKSWTHQASFLESQGWERLYQDDQAVILRRKEAVSDLSAPNTHRSP